MPPIPPVKPDIISSTVLPGFQFRESDLQRQPSPEERSEDSVYRAFMLPALQAARRAQQAEREARERLERLLEEADGRVQREREARLAAEARLRQLEAELARRQ